MKLVKQIVLILLIIIFIIFTIYTLLYLNEKFEFFCTNSQGSEYYQIYGVFGDFVGGVIGTILTAITVIFVFLTYYLQKKELELQRKLIKQQQFESTFFNMLNVHRELKKNFQLNSLDFFFCYEDLDYLDVFEGIGVFKKISDDYKKIYNDLEFLHYNIDKISNRVFKNNLSDPQFLFDLNNDNSNPRPILLADTIESKWEENNNKIETHKTKIQFTFELLFDNYQNILSHYCRNVYHILKFIRKTEEEDIYIKNNKTEYYRQYANIFQSQLNADEHFILFYNFIWHHDNHQKNEIYFPINIINKYQFLENIGIDNLILHNHKKQYEFPLKGDF